MIAPVLIRAGALYIPIVLALIAHLLFGRRPRQFAACLLSTLWVAPTLVVLQQMNHVAGWWTYSDSIATFCGMPLELYLGWIVLWGVLPQLALSRLPIALCAGLMIMVDLIAMPLCKPVLLLGPRWLMGEALAALMVLAPALAIARWTSDDSHLRARSAMQVVISAMLFLYLVPELVFALRPGGSWTPLFQMPSWQRQVSLQLLILLAVPGVGAVLEFAERGMGTPIPYDPPKHLVTSGVYRYCANPMQLSCALVMLFWAFLLHNGWLFLAALTSVIYSAGIAEWDEGEDLVHRFGMEWKQYRSEVWNWLPRWRPYHAGPIARLYIAATCGPCSELRLWIEARNPIGMNIVDAETLPPGSIRRMRYDPGDGTTAVEGVRAMGRALEHLHLGWAVAGAALRLPLVWHGVQLLMDASGLGPRELQRVSS
jgi:protein-S-isoprenylcysteine O-methyltransferase Ste14